MFTFVFISNSLNFCPIFKNLFPTESLQSCQNLIPPETCPSNPDRSAGPDLLSKVAECMVFTFPFIFRLIHDTRRQSSKEVKTVEDDDDEVEFVGEVASPATQFNPPGHSTIIGKFSTLFKSKAENLII